MQDVLRFSCALFLAGASFGFAQNSTPATNAQSMGNAAASGATGMANNAANTAGNAATNAMSGTMSGDSAAEANIQKMEEELGQAYRAHDGAPFSKYLDDNIVVIFPGHREDGKAAVIQGITSNTCTETSSSDSDFAYKWISPDVVMVTYKSKSDETCKGKKSPAEEYNTSVWHRKGGNWMNMFHQSTPDTTAATAEAAEPSGAL